MTNRSTSPEARERMRQGGRNRAKAFTPEYQQQTRQALPKSVCVAGGKAAYKKLVGKYGPEYAQRKAAEWRIEHPSSLELIVMGWLGNTPHKREPEIAVNGKSYFVDFKIGNTLVEVNGEWVHSLRVESDNRKYTALQAAGYTVIILPEAEVVSCRAKAIIETVCRKVF